MEPRNESAASRVELTGRDLLDYVVGLAAGILLWVANSYSATSSLVFDPTWTTVGVGTGLALFAFLTFSGVGRRFQRGLREWNPFHAVAMAVVFLLGLWLLFTLDVTFRPAHYSWFLGLGLSQLPGIALYLRQRSAG